MGSHVLGRFLEKKRAGTILGENKSKSTQRVSIDAYMEIQNEDEGS
jgi:hypothetical protein